MRKFGILAAALACVGVGVLPAARPAADDQDQKPGTESRRKAIVVERHAGGDGQNGDVLVRSFGDDDGARIGVSVANLDEEQAKTKAGVVVTDVQKDGPGAKAGLEVADVITEFDGEKVRSARQLRRLVGETPAGRVVQLVAERDGKRVDLQVTPETREPEMAWFGGMAEMDPYTPDRMPRLHPGAPGMPGERRFFFNGPEGDRHFEFKRPGPDGDGTFDLFVAPGRGRLGVGIQDLSDQLADYFGTKDGVLVSSVTKDSPAAKAGIRAGDVITSVGGKPVTSTGELIEAVQKAGENASLEVGYVRDKKPAVATATLEPRERQRPKRPARPV
jgi:serine protease Do